MIFNKKNGLIFLFCYLSAVLRAAPLSDPKNCIATYLQAKEVNSLVVSLFEKRINGQLSKHLLDDLLLKIRVQMLRYRDSLAVRKLRENQDYRLLIEDKMMDQIKSFLQVSVAQNRFQLNDESFGEIVESLFQLYLHLMREEDVIASISRLREKTSLLVRQAWPLYLRDGRLEEALARRYWGMVKYESLHNQINVRQSFDVRMTGFEGSMTEERFNRFLKSLAKTKKELPKFAKFSMTFNSMRLQELVLNQISQKPELLEQLLKNVGATSLQINLPSRWHLLGSTRPISDTLYIYPLLNAGSSDTSGFVVVAIPGTLKWNPSDYRFLGTRDFEVNGRKHAWEKMQFYFFRPEELSSIIPRVPVGYFTVPENKIIDI